jgi:uncharacterized protein YggE
MSEYTPVAVPPPIKNSPLSLLQSKALLILLGLGCLILAVFLFPYFKGERTIITTGYASKNFEIDRAEITLLLVSQSADVVALRTNALSNVSSLVNDLNNYGATSVVTNQPQIIPQALGNYQLRQNIQVQANGSESVSELLAFLKTQDAIITSAAYFTKDETNAQATLLKDSTDNARIKADLLAESQSLEIVGIKSIVEVESTVELGSSVNSVSDPSANLQTTNGDSTKLQKTVSVTFYARNSLF